MSRSSKLGDSASQASAITAPNHGDDLRDQVRVLGDDVKELARLTKDAIGRKVDDAKDGASAAYERGRDKVVGYGEHVADATREHPLRSVLVAVGIGALIGVIVGRR